jgi:hypothetical protein
MKASPIKKIRICYQCDKDIYPKGRILFDDQFARQDNKGNWHCIDCMKEDFNNDLLRRAPNSLAAKEIIAERKRKEDFKMRYEKVRKQSGERLAFDKNMGLRKYT